MCEGRFYLSDLWIWTVRNGTAGTAILMFTCKQFPLKSILQACKLSKGLNSHWKVSAANSMSHINPAEHIPMPSDT